MDLMCWEDNLEYFTHKNSEAFSDKNCWNRGYEIKSSTELTALLGIAHNTGNAFLYGNDAGSLWLSLNAVFSYWQALGSDEALSANKLVFIQWRITSKSKKV